MMHPRTIARRDFLKSMGVGAASLALMGTLGTAESPKKPNIIYFLADDLGWGDLSCQGQKKFQTPNIDRMAAEGLRFTQHYAGCTVCAPSRCCLMTGLHTGHAYVRGNKGMKPEGQFPIPADCVTIMERFKQAGYRTGMFGKWGLGGPGSTGDPMDHGLDEFFGYNCQSLAHNYYPDYLWHNREKVELGGKTYSHDLIVEHAMQFIRDNKDRPFFCYMPVTIPHAALQVPEESVAPFRKLFPEFEKVVVPYENTEIRNPPACFAGMVTRLDGQVGKLFELLKELGLDNNTLVIFTSDNGPHRESGEDPEFFDSNGPFKGIKRDLYEGGIRVPMIARWPGKIRPGTETNHISAFWDILPTFGELAGYPVPDGIDGISMLPTLLGEPEKQKNHVYLYWEFHEKAGAQALRIGKWKAVRRDVKTKPDASIEIYDLDNDPGETTDLAGKQPDIVAQAKGLFSTARTESKEFTLFGGSKE